MGLVGGMARAAEPAEIGLRLEPSYEVDLARERAAEDTQALTTRLHAWARGSTENGRWFLGIKASHTVLFGLDTEAAVELRADLCGVSGRWGPLWVEAGNLRNPWGELLILPSLDVLDARDLRAGFLTPLDWQRLPSPAVHAELGEDKVRFGMWILPFGASDRSSLVGTDTSILRQGMVADLTQDVGQFSADPLTASFAEQLSQGLATGLQTVDPQLRRGLDNAFASSGRPRPLIEATDVGARLRARTGPLDLGLVGAWMRSRTPLTTLNPEIASWLQDKRLPTIADPAALDGVLQEPLSTSWPRTGLVGGHAGAILGAWGVKAESSFLTHKAVPTRYLGGVTSPAVSVGTGLDRNFGSGTRLLVEARWEHLFQPPPDPFWVAPDDIMLGMGLQSKLARERLELQLGGLHSFAFEESLLRPGIALRPSDQVEIGIQAAIALAATEAPDDWESALNHPGGPISALGDTSAISLRFAWIR